MLGASLALASAHALAAQWQPIAEYPGISAEIDAASIRARGSLFEATFRFTHASPQTNRDSGIQYRSAEVQSLFDCDAKKFVPFHRVEFSDARGTGTVIATVVVPESKIRLESITTGSMNDVMLNRVCAIGRRSGS
jgi:hypothetical protein